MKQAYLAFGLLLTAAIPAFGQADLLSLPLADSFAGARFASFWTLEAVNGNYNWEAVAKPEDTPSPEPYDADGGIAYYHSYRAFNNNSARMATAPIDAASATAPVIQFYMYHHTIGVDRLRVQVSVDGGEWTDVEGAEYAVKAEPAGWQQHIVPLAEAVPAGAGQFRVALTAESAYGYNIVVDNVRLFNMAGKDIAVAISEDARLVAGLSSELGLLVINNGASPVAAADYSLSVDAPEGIEVGAPASVDLPALGSVAIPVAVSIDALQAHAAASYEFSASVLMEGDEVASNNTSAVTVPTAFSASPAVTGAGIERVDGADVLSWNHAIDPGYAPIALSEGFEDFEDGFSGPFNGWEAFDLDGKDGGSFYNANGSALNVGVIPQGSSWRNLVRGFEGDKMLCVTVPSAVQQDDWLVSPLLNADPGSTLTLSFKIGFRNFSVSQINNFEILYSTSDGELDPAKPSTLLDAQFEDVKVTVPASSSGTSGPVDLAEMTFEGIPSSAKRVAIHFKSKMTSYVANAMWIDCLSLTEVNPVTLHGYNVYELGHGRINEAVIPAGTNRFIIPAADGSATRQFFVSALYDDGEAEPSNVAILGAQSSLDLNAADDAPAEYFNLQGLRMANPLPGQPVIVRKAGRVTKTIAR